MEAMKPKLTAIAPWFGGKRTLSDKIVAQLGNHDQYFEPFCGSLAVVLAKEPCQQEIVNDLHGDVTNLAWVLQGPKTAEELYDRAARTLFCEDMIRSFWEDVARNPCPSHVDTDRAFKYLVSSWVMRNGVAGTTRAATDGFQIAVRFTLTGGSPTRRFTSVVESIPAWHYRLRNVMILRRNAFKLIGKFSDHEDLAIYADPPYMPETRSGFFAKGAKSHYEHEFNHSSKNNLPFADEEESTVDHHQRLRDALSEFKEARVVVSYYDCERVRELYQGWTFVEAPMQKNLNCAAARGERQKTANEVLIINGDPFEVPGKGK